MEGHELKIVAVSVLFANKMYEATVYIDIFDSVPCGRIVYVIVTN